MGIEQRTGPRRVPAAGHQPPFPPSRSGSRAKPSGRNAVVISYSHHDLEWLDKLTVHLSLLPEQMDVWDDRKIAPGDLWRREIEVSLASARVAILLVTPHFLHSTFIKRVELPLLLDAADHGELKIIPVIVRRTLLSYLQGISMPSVTGPAAEPLWDQASLRLARIQPINDHNEPLSEMNESQQDRLFVELAVAVWKFLGTPGSEMRADFAAP